MNVAIASSTSRSSWTGPILCATCATCRSTNDAASGERSEGLVRDPAGQPRPQITLHHPAPHPRSRWASSSACPTHRFPASVETPIAAGRCRELQGVPDVPRPGIRRHTDGGGELGDRELRHQRSTLTRGDPHPGVAVPVPRSSQRPRSSRSSAWPPSPPPGTSNRASSWSAACLDARAAANTAVAVSSSSAYLVMDQTRSTTTDTPSPKTPCLTGMWRTNRRSLSTANTTVESATGKLRSSRERPLEPPRRATT